MEYFVLDYGEELHSVEKVLPGMQLVGKEEVFPEVEVRKMEVVVVVLDLIVMEVVVAPVVDAVHSGTVDSGASACHYVAQLCLRLVWNCSKLGSCGNEWADSRLCCKHPHGDWSCSGPNVLSGQRRMLLVLLLDFLYWHLY